MSLKVYSTAKDICCNSYPVYFMKISIFKNSNRHICRQRDPIKEEA